MEQNKKPAYFRKYMPVMEGPEDMDYYLIDYENTGENGLRGIVDLDEESCTVIFYSENADKISFDMHQKLLACRTRIEYRKISTGKKNALDFQLSTYLGYLIAKSENDRFYVVSKDNGYRVVLDFWKDRDVRQVDAIVHGLRKNAAAAQQTSAVAVSAEQEGAQPEPASAEQKESLPKSETPAALQALPIPAPTAEKEQGITWMNVPLPARSRRPRRRRKTEASEASEMVTALTVPVPTVPAPPAAAPAAEGSVPSDPASAVPASADPAPVEPVPSEPVPSEPVPAAPVPAVPDLKEQVAQVISEPEVQENICRFITKYKTKQGVNNALVKLYGSEKAGELYKKIKPLIKDKKGK